MHPQYNSLCRLRLPSGTCRVLGEEAKPSRDSIYNQFDDQHVEVATNTDGNGMMRRLSTSNEFRGVGTAIKRMSLLNV